ALAHRDDAGALRERRRAGDRVCDELRHRLHERSRERPVPETPPCQRERLAESIEDDGPLEQALLTCDRDMRAVVEEVGVELVREHPDVVIARDPRDLTYSLARERATGRVVRAVQD